MPKVFAIISSSAERAMTDWLGEEKEKMEAITYI